MNIILHGLLQNRFSESVTVRDSTWVCSPVLLGLMGFCICWYRNYVVGILITQFVEYLVKNNIK